MKKLVSVILVLAMIMMMGVSVFATDEASGEVSASASSEASSTADAPVVEISGPTTAEQSGWMYTEEDGVITIIQAPQSVKSEMVVLVPGYIGTETVDALGDGGAVMSNNKLEGTYVLFPEELGYIADSAIHDFNDTIAWVIPATVEVSDSPWLSCSGYVITEEGSSAAAAAEFNGKETVSMDGCIAFVVDPGENGTITPAGTYYVPEDAYGLSTELTVSAAEGYKIASITVDGETTTFDELTQEFTLVYTFSADSAAVEAEFVALGEDEAETRSFSTGEEYSYVDIVDGAVAEGTELPEDLYEVQNPNTSVTDYVHALGVSTGVYYVYEDSLYEEVYCSQASDEVEYLTKAEVINGIYETEGLVYGEDYDIIRLHNYYANITSGPSSGVVIMYCTYLYKLVDETSEDGSVLDGETVYSADNVDHASVFVQGTGSYTIDNLTVFCYTSGRGPSESGNFYGVGSQVHVDGGTEGKITESDIHYDTATLVLNQPQILGTNNSIYATGSGLAIINGGDIFACSSGGHGPYVSQGGQIIINVEGTNLINEDGSVNIIDPEATEIPDYSYAAMTQDEDGENVLDITEHPDDVTVIVSGLDAGTALATDKGGGTIVANRVVTKCYGLRSAGVYTIGYSESWVYVFNSNCTSNLDAALCSASAGYGYAFNCRLQGCMGIKVRASGTSGTEDAGIWVENCRVSAYYDAEEEENAYLVGSPDEFLALIGEEAGIEPQGEDETYAEYLTRADAALYQYIVEEGNSYGTSMNIFIDSANTPHYNENGILWWYLDRSKTPGYSGGNKFAVIYSDGSPAVVNITASLLVNDNYTYYGPESEWWNGLTEEEQSYYTPADNLIASAENGGQLNVTFTDENSSTYWDVTGESDETCEMNGDFYVGGKSTNGINATFINSEWTGTIIFEEPSSEEDTIGTAYIVLTEGSVWTVTEECTVNGLTVDETSTIIGTVTENADGTYTITPSEEATSGIEADEDAAASGEAAASAEVEETAAVAVDPAAYTADWAGYQAYCIDCLGNSTNEEVAQMAIAEIEATEEAAYSDDATPFAMLIEFGDIVSYSDFLASAGGADETAAESAALEGKDAFDAYVQYLRDYMDAYEGEGDGSGFDDSAKTMALGELDTVAYGDDVNDFPFEMFVSQFGADDYDTWLASQK
ncbi:MAG: hypothetical protein LUE22_00005 [Oscillospiraceae bacterium]|nr:hypothetical protein [Oscillospiraceae bacterium]